MTVIAVDTFSLAAGVDRDAFVAADERVQQAFAYQQPGLERRTAASGAGNRWLVIEVWGSHEELDAARAAEAADGAVQAWQELVDMSTRRREVFDTLD